MKYFQYVVTLMVLGLLLSSLAMAGKTRAGSVVSKSPLSAVQPGSKLTHTPSQIPPKYQKFEARIQSDAAQESGKLMKTGFRTLAKSVEPAPDIRAISAAPLAAGTYDVPSGTYTTIKDAIADINANGLAGNVIIRLVATTYYENPITLGGSYPGAGTYSVTITPAVGVAATVNFTSYAINGKGFAFVGANNATIDGVNSGGSSLTLTYSTLSTFPASDPQAAVIYISGASQNITVKNATITGIANNAVWSNATDARDGVNIWDSGTGSSNITIDHNTFLNCYTAVKALSSTAGVYKTGVAVTNNSIGNAFGGYSAMGFVGEFLLASHFDGNTLDGLQYNSAFLDGGYTGNDVSYGVVASGFGISTVDGFVAGLWMISADSNSTMNNNVLRNYNAHDTIRVNAAGVYTVYGARVSGVSGTNMMSAVQNRIGDIICDGDNSASIYSFRIVNAKVYHNAIHLAGVTAQDLNPNTGTLVVGLRPTAGIVKNNAVYIETDAGPNGLDAAIVYGGGTENFNAVGADPGFGVTQFGFGDFSLRALQASTGQDLQSAEGNPNFLDAALHIDPTAFSIADGIGQGGLTSLKDIDGDTRSLTTPDAGVDEFTDAVPFTSDVNVVDIPTPNPLSTLAGLPTSISARINNVFSTATALFNVTATVDTGSGHTVVYTSVVNTSLNAAELKTVTFTPQWTPTPATATRITVTTALAGDQVAGNNSYHRSQAVDVQASGVSYSSGFETAGDQKGWLATGIWKFETANAVLGGEHSGTKSAVTDNAGGDYTIDATNPGCGNHDILYTPYFDFSSNPNPVISFFHSIETEPVYDGGRLEYSVDTGQTWHELGGANDVNGINWMSTTVWQNANSQDSGCWAPYAGYLLGSAYAWSGNCWQATDFIESPKWTSNGDCEGADVPTGPHGFVFSAYKDNGGLFGGKQFVRFRFRFFSDGGNGSVALHGWAIDDFAIGTALPPLQGVTISGTVYRDLNGNGTNDDATPLAGKVVDLQYYGVHVAYDTTDGTGAYSFPPAVANLPGLFNVYVAHTGYGLSQPANGILTYAINSNSDLSVFSGEDFGIYYGRFLGKVYNDLNHNGVNNAEPGLKAWTVNVTKDSLNGTNVGVLSTDSTGTYSFLAGPGTYYVSEVVKSNWVKTAPATGYTVTIAGADSTVTALAAGDFGDFNFGIVRVVCAADVSGDGIKQATDIAPLTTGATQLFNFYHGNTLVKLDTVGNTTSYFQHAGLDSGTYTVKRVSVSPPAGWLKTSAADSITFVISQSGALDTAAFLYFKTVSASGRKFNDINGNGVEDTLEPGIPGWNIHISGTGGGTVVTDTNGNWTITTLGPGSHTVTEDTVVGYTPTFAAGGLTFTAQSANINSNNKFGLDFGNFHNVTVGGTVFRDRNHNGVRDAGEEVLSGITVGVTGKPNTTTDANGAFSFTNLPPAPDTVHLTVSPDTSYTTTSGPFTIVLRSGDTTKKSFAFGLFKVNDNAKYRTWTSAQLLTGAGTKIQKAWTAKKPSIPTLANMLNSVFLTQSALVKEGIAGQMNPSSKEYPYILPAKYTDVFATFSAKGVGHTGVSRGLDVDNKGGLLLKKYKSIPYTKKNDVLIADLLALKVNIASSAAGVNPTGLGGLIYHEAGNPLSGKTISQISVACDTVMTLWQGVPYSTYVMYDSVIAKINAAFSDNSAVPLDTTVWRTSGATATVKATGVATVYQVAFLSANPGAAPEQVVGGKIPSLPASYKLEQNYPNPFNPTTSITFEVPGPAVVTIKVYNMLGQEVATLLNNQVYDIATRDNVDFNGANLASGVYFYRITAQSLDDNGVQSGKSFTQVKKMLLVK